MLGSGQESVLVLTDLVKVYSVFANDRVVQRIYEERWLYDVLDSVAALSLTIIIKFDVGKACRSGDRYTGGRRSSPVPIKSPS